MLVTDIYEKHRYWAIVLWSEIIERGNLEEYSDDILDGMIKAFKVLDIHEDEIFFFVILKSRASFLRIC